MADELRNSYSKQAEATNERNKLIKQRSLEQDTLYLSGFRTAKNRADFRHTSGNMGMLLSQTQDELDLIKRNSIKNA